MAPRTEGSKSTAGIVPAPSSFTVEDKMATSRPAKRRKVETKDIPTTGEELSEEDQRALDSARRASVARGKRNKRSQACTAGEKFVNSENPLPERVKAIAGRRPTKEWPNGGVQKPGFTVAFPSDSSLVVEDIEQLTTVCLTPDKLQLKKDIHNFCTKEGSELVDDPSTVHRFESQDRTFDRFNSHGRRVVKVKMHGVDLYERGGELKFGQCAANLAINKELDDKVGPQPHLGVEQRVMADVWLENHGDMGGEALKATQKLQLEARRRFRFESGLQERIEREIRLNLPMSKARYEMLKIVEETVRIKTNNPFHLAKRNEYAVEHGLYERIADFDIFIAVDRYDRVLAFEDQYAVQRLLGDPVLTKLAEAFSVYTKLVRLEYPDATRHFEHQEWMEERPEFDINASDADPRIANPGSVHAGCGCQVGDTKGTRGISTKAAGKYAQQNPFSEEQFKKFKYGVLGAGNEILSFYFSAIDAELLQEYRRIWQAIPEQTRMETRRDGSDTFALVAILNKLMTSMHVDKSDVKEGFAGILSFGDFQGGDIVFPELGLQIEAKSGCAQLFRGGKMQHYIVKWEGPERCVLVYADGEDVRGWAYENVFKTAIPAPPPVEEDERIRQAKLSVQAKEPGLSGY